MILRSEGEKAEFELRVLGYEFPEITQAKYDSNWLMIRVSVSDVDISWSSTHPCLLTWESHWLLNWLADLVSGDEKEAEMSFLESNFSLFLVGREGGRIHLRIRFREKLRPRVYGAEAACAFEIQLEVSLSTIQEAVNALSRGLRPFPMRAGASWRCRPCNDPRTVCILCTQENSH